VLTSIRTIHELVDHSTSYSASRRCVANEWPAAGEKRGHPIEAASRLGFSASAFNLDGHLTIEIRVPRTVHFAHPARADLGRNKSLGRCASAINNFAKQPPMRGRPDASDPRPLL
jgi:hypothetical protein